MGLTKEQSEELHRAILRAFPTKGELTRVVKHKLGQNLEEVAGDGTLSDVTLRLVARLEARNEVGDFIKGARADNPGNEDLRLFEERHSNDLKQSAKSTVTLENEEYDEAFERETSHARREIRRTIPGLENPLPRSEIDWLEEQLGNSTPVLFTGDAGTGKSGVADSLADTAYKQGKAVLFLDARRTASVHNGAQLQQHLGLTASVISAVREVGRRRGCRLIIEQLDSSIGYDASRVLIDFAVDCCGLDGVETVVVSRKREANEVALLQPLTKVGFKEQTSYPLGAGDAQRVLEQLGIENASTELVEMGRNLLNLELIGRIKDQQQDYDFSQVTTEVDLWEQYIETITERERMLSNPQAARQVIAEAMHLARLGLNREDGTFILDYDTNPQQDRLISWEVIVQEEGRRYRFRHEKLQDYLYAKDACERTLMPSDVEKEISPARVANVIQWMSKIYQRSGSETTRRRFLEEALNVGK